MSKHEAFKTLPQSGGDESNLLTRLNPRTPVALHNDGMIFLRREPEIDSTLEDFRAKACEIRERMSTTESR
jgi:hypothetical protein